ncbi:MAG: hypothetical protein MI700_04800, partial [Balneolales bacterium]|nr:hypothetical protein [Balneolales bacterium]
TPGTLYNERLIEHWERIAHARSTFTRNNRGIYGADDRGEIFVRYGAPDKTFTGTILTSITEITNTCSTFGRCNEFIMAEVIRSNDPMPRYEIWVYDRPNRYMRDNLIYLFAETSTSRFKRFNTVEELIPPQFFTLSTSRYDFSSFTGGTDSGTMSPGMVLQWVYYNEFSSYDILFGKQVSKMEQNWVGTPTKRSEQGPHQGQVLAQEIRNDLVDMKREAPTEKSKLTEELSEIPLQTFPYRFLNHDGSPYYALFLSSDIYEPIALDFVLNRNANKLVADDSTLLINELKNYDLFHGINIQKQNGELFSKSRRNIGIALDGDLNMKNQNVYQIPFTNEEKETVVYAELYGTHDPGIYDQDTPFDPTLKGIGKAIVELPDHLEWKEDELILADIILGYDMDYELEQAFIPFTPSHDKTIPMNEVLAMHFEVYNLATNENGEGHFQFNYQVTKPRSFQWIRGRANEVRLSATFTTIGGMFSEDIEIQTRDLQEGKYTLEIEIRDLISDQKIERKIDFIIVE